MIFIEDILLPGSVALELTGSTAASAVLEVAQRLRGESKVRDWNSFFSALTIENSCMANEKGYGVCIPHARTNHVSSMVMAAGRAKNGIWFDKAQMQIHYIFVIGVPVALGADYLRIIGALARAFRVGSSEEQLREVTTPKGFIELLSRSEQTL